MTYAPASSSRDLPSRLAAKEGRRASPNQALGAEALAPWVCLIAAMTLWAASIPLMERDSIGDFGLIALLPGTMVPAYACVAAGLVIALRGKSSPGFAPYALILMLVVLLHGTPALAYENLRYAWAWKHLGVIEFIQRTGAPDPSSEYLAAYHNWPGFFLFFAQIGHLFNLDAMAMSQLARFSPLVLNVLYATVLPYIFRRLTTDLRVVWTATTVFIVGNWVGQDYFSPQGTAFLLLLVLLALCLGPLARYPRRPWKGQHPFFKRLWRLQLWTTRRAPVLPRELPKGRKLAAIGIALMLILAIVATHQLTPLVMIMMLLGLFVVGRLSINYALFACTAEMAWLLLVADPFMGRVLPSVMAEFGTIGSGTFEAIIDWTKVSEGQRLASLASRGMVAAIAAAAIAGCLMRLRWGYRDGVAAVLALAPIPLAMTTSYGGEVLFRVYFFALPFLGFFAAALVFPTPKARLNPINGTVLCLLLMTASAGFIIANNGKDAQYRFSSGEVEAARWVYTSAPPGTLLIEGADTYPMQFQNYENFIYVPLAVELPTARTALLDDPAGLLGGWLRSHGGPAYAIFTRSQNAYYQAMQPLDGVTLADIVAALLQSPDLEVAFATQDAIVFQAAPLSGDELAPEALVRERFQLDKLAAFSGLGEGSSAFSREDMQAWEEARLTRLLVETGYRDARVTIAPGATTDSVWQADPLVEVGPLYRFSAMMASGLDDARLAGLSSDVLGLTSRVTGAPASRAVVEHLRDDVIWLLGQSGYPFATATVVEMDIRQPDALLSAELRIDTGTRASIGVTRIEGVSQSLEADIAARVRLPENEPYSPERFNSLHSAVLDLPSITQTRIEIAPVAPDLVDVVLQVRPAPSALGLERDTLGIILAALALTSIAMREGFALQFPQRRNAARATQTAIAAMLLIVFGIYMSLRLAHMLGI